MNKSKIFKSPTEVKSLLEDQQYLATDDIANITYLSQELAKPLLVEGPAGVGKTELAKAVASSSGRQLIRLQCYEGLDESKALYEWEYAKQLLYTQLLKDNMREVLDDTKSLAEAVEKLSRQDDIFFSQSFLLQRPLLQAILSDSPTVLLIDEIDRADAEFEAFLLEILSDFQVSIPELGTLKAKHIPFVLLTSNNSRELSEALKRRCLYLFIDYPTLEQELAVLNKRVPGLSQKLADQAVRVVRRLRKMDLRKSPSVSETIDWANALIALNSDQIDAETLKQTMSILLKHEHDIASATRKSSSLIREDELPDTKT